MEAIQTQYDGYKFRSRLEARWAVLFNSLNINYRYECEGYILEDGRKYLPDFYLPNIGSSWVNDDNGIFVEIKPAHIDVDNKWELFGKQSEIPIILLGPLDIFNGGDITNGFHWIHSNDFSDGPYLFCECESCKEIGLEFDGRSGRIGCKCGQQKKRYNSDSYNIRKAYRHARQARFEHGEVPIV